MARNNKNDTGSIVRKVFAFIAILIFIYTIIDQSQLGYMSRFTHQLFIFAMSILLVGLIFDIIYKLINKNKENDEKNIDNKKTDTSKIDSQDIDQ